MNGSIGIGSMVSFSFLDERDRPVPALNAETGERVWGGWWYPNLITNQGLDGIASYNSLGTYADGYSYPRTDAPGIRNTLGLATGSFQVKRPSGGVTLAQSGNTVTASANFFNSGDVGAEIVWDNATRATITGYTSPTVVTVADSKSVSAAPATLWAVQLTTIPGQAETGSSSGGYVGSINAYASGPDLVVEAVIPTVVQLIADRNLTGFRFGPDNNNSAHIVENFRDAGGNPITVSLANGKKVRVDHLLQMRISGAQAAQTLNFNVYDAANQLISSNPVSVNYKARWPNLNSGIILVLNPNRNTDGLSFAGGSETLNSTNWSQISSSVNLGAYTPGLFKRTKTLTVSESNGNGTWIGWAFERQAGIIGNFPGVRCVLNSGNFTKDNTQQMAFDLELSWGREYA